MASRRLTCSYAHRMRNTRTHAPILEVVAAAGVQVYASRGVQRDSADSSPWRQHVYATTTSRRQKRRECESTEYCDSDACCSSSRKRSGSSAACRGASRRHLGDAAEEADSEGERDRQQQQQQRKAVLARNRANGHRKSPRIRVANPDRVHPPRSQSTEKYEMWRPSKAAVAKQAQDEYDREDDDAYMLTHEVLSYSFGNRKVD